MNVLFYICVPSDFVRRSDLGKSLHMRICLWEEFWHLNLLMAESDRPEVTLCGWQDVLLLVQLLTNQLWRPCNGIPRTLKFRSPVLKIQSYERVCVWTVLTDALSYVVMWNGTGPRLFILMGFHDKCSVNMSQVSVLNAQSGRHRFSCWVPSQYKLDPEFVTVHFNSKSDILVMWSVVFWLYRIRLGEFAWK